MIRRGFLTIVLAHALVVAAFDGSGDGSGEDDRCSPPNPRPELLGGSIDVAGFMEPRCHLACIESVRDKILNKRRVNSKLRTKMHFYCFKTECFFSSFSFFTDIFRGRNYY